MGDGGTERIDAAIDRLDAALRFAGLGGLAAEAEPELLAEIEQELAPFALPADLLRFWERAQLTEPTGWSMPEPCNAYAALDVYRMNVGRFPGVFGPPILFPIARKSESQWSIELAGPAGTGGLIVSHDAVISLQIRYPSFTDLVEVYAELVENGRFVRRGNGHSVLERDPEHERQEARLEAAGIAERTIELDARMPAHWLASAGLAPAGRATHTVAELVRASSRAPLQARIAGRLWSLAGAGTDETVVVDDGTGSLEVRCPADLEPWRLGRDGDRFELEVAVKRPIRTRPEPGAVVATAVRPLG